MSDWRPSRDNCQDDWQRFLWDSAGDEGFVFGYQSGVAQALYEVLFFYEDNGLDVPHGLRDAVLILLEGKDV